MSNITSPFVSGTVVTKTQLDTLVTAINALPQGNMGSAATATAQTLSAASQAATVVVTATNTATRTFKVTFTATYQAATAPGNVAAQCGYASGATFASQTNIGVLTRIQATNTGASGAQSITVVATVRLAAGTWTFGAIVQRGGGSTTDTLTGQTLLVEDVGV